MSYNGIGLATARGSGTSGHIQKNMSYVKPEFFRKKVSVNRGEKLNSGGVSKANSGNADIIEHNRKREIEAKVFEFQDTLEEEGTLSTSEIEERVHEYRARLEATQDNYINSASRESADRYSSSRNVTDTHVIADRKMKQNERAQNAFGIRDNFKSGSSFDPEAQAQRRIEEKEARAREYKERQEAYEQRKIARENKEKERLARMEQNRRDRENEKNSRKIERFSDRYRYKSVSRSRSRSRSPNRDSISRSRSRSVARSDSSPNENRKRRSVRHGDGSNSDSSGSDRSNSVDSRSSYSSHGSSRSRSRSRSVSSGR